GDLQGVLNRLDYLKQLGIGFIYFNPLFWAPSNSKYDGASFHHIDPTFGPNPAKDKETIAKENPIDPKTWIWTEADKLFLKVIHEAHKRGIKVVLDGVFNHTGKHFFAFKDILARGQKSRFLNWYDITAWSADDNPRLVNWKKWFGFSHLPEVRREGDSLHSEYKDYVFNSLKRWMKPGIVEERMQDGIDGWRLDVFFCLPSGFRKELYEEIKKIHPRSIVIAEGEWEAAHKYVQESSADSAMNYPYLWTLGDFLINQKKRIPVSEFCQKMQKVFDTYPQEAAHVMFNLLGSHDTERIVSAIRNPDMNRWAHIEHNQNSRLKNNSAYDIRMGDESTRRIQKLLALYQMTSPGMPVIFYGDEIGMPGANDPCCRKPMPWPDKVKPVSEYYPDLKLFRFYQKLIAIRNKSEALKRGSYEVVYSNDDQQILGFKRRYKDEEVFVFINNSNKTHPLNLLLSTDQDNRKLAEPVNGRTYRFKNGKLEITLPALSGAILSTASSSSVPLVTSVNPPSQKNPAHLPRSPPVKQPDCSSNNRISSSSPLIAGLQVRARALRTKDDRAKMVSEHLNMLAPLQGKIIRAKSRKADMMLFPELQAHHMPHAKNELRPIIEYDWKTTVPHLREAAAALTTVIGYGIFASPCTTLGSFINLYALFFPNGDIRFFKKFTLPEIHAEVFYPSQPVMGEKYELSGRIFEFRQNKFAPIICLESIPEVWKSPGITVEQGKLSSLFSQADFIFVPCCVVSNDPEIVSAKGYARQVYADYHKPALLINYSSIIDTNNAEEKFGESVFVDSKGKRHALNNEEAAFLVDTVTEKFSVVPIASSSVEREKHAAQGVLHKGVPKILLDRFSSGGKILIRIDFNKPRASSAVSAPALLPDSQFISLILTDKAKQARDAGHIPERQWERIRRIVRCIWEQDGLATIEDIAGYLECKRSDLIRWGDLRLINFINLESESRKLKKPVPFYRVNLSQPQGGVLSASQKERMLRIIAITETLGWRASVNEIGDCLGISSTDKGRIPLVFSICADENELKTFLENTINCNRRLKEKLPLDIYVDKRTKNLHDRFIAALEAFDGMALADDLVKVLEIDATGISRVWGVIKKGIKALNQKRIAQGLIPLLNVIHAKRKKAEDDIIRAFEELWYVATIKELVRYSARDKSTVIKFLNSKEFSFLNEIRIKNGLTPLFVIQKFQQRNLRSLLQGKLSLLQSGEVADIVKNEGIWYRRNFGFVGENYFRYITVPFAYNVIYGPNGKNGKAESVNSWAKAERLQTILQHVLEATIRKALDLRLHKLSRTERGHSLEDSALSYYFGIAVPRALSMSRGTLARVAIKNGPSGEGKALKPDDEHIKELLVNIDKAFELFTAKNKRINESSRPISRTKKVELAHKKYQEIRARENQRFEQAKAMMSVASSSGHNRKKNYLCKAGVDYGLYFMVMLDQVPALLEGQEISLSDVVTLAKRHSLFKHPVVTVNKIIQWGVKESYLLMPDNKAVKLVDKGRLYYQGRSKPHASSPNLTGKRILVMSNHYTSPTGQAIHIATLNQALCERHKNLTIHVFYEVPLSQGEGDFAE
ncbi:MAG: alpha-amylase family glycosyl hydrolase, partial [Candidatus Omnitrophota bacterium]